MYQIGIVSYSGPCGAGPGVYTSVTSAKLWDTLGESTEGKLIKEALHRCTRTADRRSPPAGCDRRSPAW
ncbi:hypothetical protein [Streptomyces sp. NA02950]|uniref:hypothetical protein n=1 Tax=Streptomyces sp. NA02950 TaxID=2742137 RepID=UPI0020CB0ECF|nr:hypothetical protein [Streptomyces sp. NA02950]